MTATSSGTGDRRDSLLQAHLCLLTTMALFGSAFASSKVVVGYLPHSVAAALRFGGGAIVLLLITLALRRKGGSFSRRDWFKAGAVGLLGVFAYNVFFFWGLSLAPSIDGSIIVPVLSPVITTGVLLLMGQERPSARTMAGLLLGLGGTAVFFLGPGTALDGRRLTGDLIYLLGAVAWAVYSITSKRVLVRMDPLRATTAGTAIGALMLIVFAIPSMPDADWGAVPGYAWANVAYLAIGPTAIAYLCFYWGLRSVSPSTATIAMFAVPIFGITCALVFLGETFHPLQVVGAAIMVAGALLAVSGQFRRPARPAEPEPGAPPLSPAEAASARR